MKRADALTETFFVKKLKELIGSTDPSAGSKNEFETVFIRIIPKIALPAFRF
jgi:hypothetical protein